MTRLQLYMQALRGAWNWTRDSVGHLWRTSLWNRLALVVITFVVAIFVNAYAIAQWYAKSEAHKPFSTGVTFIPEYARHLGLDQRETYMAILQDLRVRQLRLVSYWKEHEQTPGTYDFTELDWQFARAEERGIKISLAIGLRQPRWPECHQPKWADSLPKQQFDTAITSYIQQVVARYKDSPSLSSYQLENEAFLHGFGTCTNFDRERIVREFKLVKQLDPHHPIIMSRSDNLPTWQLGEPQPDVTGVSVYRRVWDGRITKRYFTYPLPAWYYGFLAGTQKILHGQSAVIHELQAEPWPPNGKTIKEISLDEQNKSFKPGDLTSRVQFAKDTGLRSADLWGAEYWYYRKQKLNDPAIWDEAREVFKDN